MQIVLHPILARCKQTMLCCMDRIQRYYTSGRMHVNVANLGHFYLCKVLQGLLFFHDMSLYLYLDHILHVDLMEDLTLLVWGYCL